MASKSKKKAKLEESKETQPLSNAISIQSLTLKAMSTDTSFDYVSQFFPH